MLLIDPNDVYKLFSPNGMARLHVADIDEILRVDAVEVVRCKDCKSWEQYNACDGTKPHRCMNHDAIFYKRTAPNDFCSYGERKDNGQG